jgi:hypothetical protein
MDRFSFEDKAAFVAACLASAITVTVIVDVPPDIWNVWAIYVPPIVVLWVLAPEEFRTFHQIALGAIAAVFFGAFPVMLLASVLGIW